MSILQDLVLQALGEDPTQSALAKAQLARLWQEPKYLVPCLEWFRSRPDLIEAVYGLCRGEAINSLDDKRTEPGGWINICGLWRLYFPEKYTSDHARSDHQNEDVINMLMMGREGDYSRALDPKRPGLVFFDPGRLPERRRSLGSYMLAFLHMFRLVASAYQLAKLPKDRVWVAAAYRDLLKCLIECAPEFLNTFELLYDTGEPLQSYLEPVAWVVTQLRQHREFQHSLRQSFPKLRRGVWAYLKENGDATANQPQWRDDFTELLHHTPEQKARKPTNICQLVLQLRQIDLADPTRRSMVDKLETLELPTWSWDGRDWSVINDEKRLTSFRTLIGQAFQQGWDDNFLNLISRHNTPDPNQPPPRYIPRYIWIADGEFIFTALLLALRKAHGGIEPGTERFKRFFAEQGSKPEQAKDCIRFEYSDLGIKGSLLDEDVKAADHLAVLPPLEPLRRVVDDICGLFHPDRKPTARFWSLVHVLEQRRHLWDENSGIRTLADELDSHLHTDAGSDLRERLFTGLKKLYTDDLPKRLPEQEGSFAIGRLRTVMLEAFLRLGEKHSRSLMFHPLLQSRLPNKPELLPAANLVGTFMCVDSEKWPLCFEWLDYLCRIDCLAIDEILPSLISKQMEEDERLFHEKTAVIRSKIYRDTVQPRIDDFEKTASMIDMQAGRLMRLVKQLKGERSSIEAQFPILIFGAGTTRIFLRTSEQIGEQQLEAALNKGQATPGQFGDVQIVETEAVASPHYITFHKCHHTNNYKVHGRSWLLCLYAWSVSRDALLIRWMLEKHHSADVGDWVGELHKNDRVFDILKLIFYRSKEVRLEPFRDGHRSAATQLVAPLYLIACLLQAAFPGTKNPDDDPTIAIRIEGGDPILIGKDWWARFALGEKAIVAPVGGWIEADSQRTSGYFALMPLISLDDRDLRPSDLADGFILLLDAVRGEEEDGRFVARQIEVFVEKSQIRMILSGTGEFRYTKEEIKQPGDGKNIGNFSAALGRWQKIFSLDDVPVPDDKIDLDKVDAEHTPVFKVGREGIAIAFPARDIPASKKRFQFTPQ